MSHYRMPLQGDILTNILSAPATHRGLLFNIFARLCEQPCHGTFRDLKKKPEKWILKAFQLDSKDELSLIMHDCEGLWHWKGEDLIVDAYDATGEEQYEQKLLSASRGGKASSEARRADNTPQPEPTQDEPPPPSYTDPGDVALLIARIIDEQCSNGTLQDKSKLLKFTAETIANQVEKGKYRHAQTRGELETLICNKAREMIKT